MVMFSLSANAIIFNETFGTSDYDILKLVSDCWDNPYYVLTNISINDLNDTDSIITFNNYKYNCFTVGANTEGHYVYSHFKNQSVYQYSSNGFKMGGVSSAGGSSRLHGIVYLFNESIDINLMNSVISWYYTKNTVNNYEESLGFIDNEGNIIIQFSGYQSTLINNYNVCGISTASNSALTYRKLNYTNFSNCGLDYIENVAGFFIMNGVGSTDDSLFGFYDDIYMNLSSYPSGINQLPIGDLNLTSDIYCSNEDEDVVINFSIDSYDSEGDIIYYSYFPDSYIINEKYRFGSYTCVLWNLYCYSNKDYSIINKLSFDSYTCPLIYNNTFSSYNGFYVDYDSSLLYLYLDGINCNYDTKALFYNLQKSPYVDLTIKGRFDYIGKNQSMNIILSDEYFLYKYAWIDMNYSLSDSRMYYYNVYNSGVNSILLYNESINLLNYDNYATIYINNSVTPKISINGNSFDLALYETYPYNISIALLTLQVNNYSRYMLYEISQNIEIINFNWVTEKLNNITLDTFNYGKNIFNVYITDSYHLNKSEMILLYDDFFISNDENVCVYGNVNNNIDLLNPDFTKYTGVWYYLAVLLWLLRLPYNIALLFGFEVMFSYVGILILLLSGYEIYSKISLSGSANPFEHTIIYLTFLCILFNIMGFIVSYIAYVIYIFASIILLRKIFNPTGE